VDTEAPSYFIIENDDYIQSYLTSLSTFGNSKDGLNSNLLTVKLEELMLYLLSKYGREFELYLQSLISKESSDFRSIIESNQYSNLKIEEIAFLCHMSLSTFKRRFIKEYNCSPGKWFQNKRLGKAKEELERGLVTPTDIYKEYGYNNLSNFSAAFKNKFGKSPNSVH